MHLITRRLFHKFSLWNFCVLSKNMSHMEVELTLQQCEKILPELQSSSHKGQCGRIGVIGGSREYTGAPYYAAITALRLGADLAHVFCSESAGIAIKCYSPDLIVHPILNDANAIEQLEEWLPKLHAIVFGPGLGRDEKIVKLSEKLLETLRSSGKITVIDADGLFVVTQKLDLLKNFPNAILTPNKNEYERLNEAVKKISSENYLESFFNDLTIIKKGKSDYIYNHGTYSIIEGGSNRRCGGQGDILSGATALFSYWADATNFDNKRLIGCYSACKFTKLLNEAAFKDKARSMITSDMIEKIPDVLKIFFIK